MNKILFFSIMTLLMLASCSSDSFKIDGEVSNLEGVQVRVTFRGDSGLVDEWAPVDKKGHFTFKAPVAQPVIVTLQDHSGKPLTAVVAQAGDHIKVKGNAGKPMGIKVKGNRLNEQWQTFRDEHADFYNDSNTTRLDAAIEKYVRENPADMLSTVLLVADYSDYSDLDKMNKLLKSIDAKARPQSLTMPLTTAIARHQRSNMPRLMSLELVKQETKKFEEIDLTEHRSFISLWANPPRNRNALKDKLQELDENISIIDILTEGDTLQWHRTIARDPKQWRHYWAPGGPLEKGIQLLRPTSLPWYAVTDSTGLITYSGPDLDAALRHL